MKRSLSVGFIGFGEAGFEIAKGLHAAGVRRIFLCHGRREDPARSCLIRERAEQVGGVVLPTAAEVAKEGKMVLSVVPPQAAASVAAQAAPVLGEGQTYIDLTSSSPEDMKKIAVPIEGRGAAFVDAAMMGSILIQGPKVLIYAAGRQAGRAARLLNGYGLNLQVVGGEPGQASAIKLILSIATKGFGSLLMEMLLASHWYRVDDYVLNALEHFFAMGVRAVVQRSVGSNAVHAGRRVEEMKSAARLLENLGIPPIMTRATTRRLKWAASLKLGDSFGGVSPEGYREVLQAWEDIGIFGEPPTRPG